MAAQSSVGDDFAAAEIHATVADMDAVDSYVRRFYDHLSSQNEAHPVTAVAERTHIVADSLGSRARLIGVSRSQPTRWINGEEPPNPENQRILIDLDYVLARANLLWPPEVVLEWLNGPTSYLDGGRPIDVVKRRGPSEVIELSPTSPSGRMRCSTSLRSPEADGLWRRSAFRMSWHLSTWMTPRHSRN